MLENTAEGIYTVGLCEFFGISCLLFFTYIFMQPLCTVSTALCFFYHCFNFCDAFLFVSCTLPYLLCKFKGRKAGNCQRFYYKKKNNTKPQICGFSKKCINTFDAYDENFKSFAFI